MNHSIRGDLEDQVRNNDYLKIDLEKSKEDLYKEHQRYEDLKKELWHNIEEKNKAEHNLSELADEVEKFKASLSD